MIIVEKAIIFQPNGLFSDDRHRIVIPKHVAMMVIDVGKQNACCSAGHTVALIKFLRDEFKLGLKDAKDLYDQILENILIIRGW